MTIQIQEVDCRVYEVDCHVYKKELKDGETIDEVLKIEQIKAYVEKIQIYFRDETQCPFGRGNWIIDLYFKNGQMTCLKFSPDITENRFKEFVKPLTDIILDN